MAAAAIAFALIFFAEEPSLSITCSVAEERAPHHGSKVTYHLGDGNNLSRRIVFE